MSSTFFLGREQGGHGFPDDAGEGKSFPWMIPVQWRDGTNPGRMKARLPGWTGGNDSRLAFITATASVKIDFITERGLPVRFPTTVGV